VRAPDLAGLYGQPVPLADGSVAVADEQYIRDSILMPSRQIAAGYADQMPSFAGVVTEADLMRLLAYIKSMAGAAP
jgi:cytochrome c oxidase subunit 2